MSVTVVSKYGAQSSPYNYVSAMNLSTYGISYFKNIRFVYKSDVSFTVAESFKNSAYRAVTEAEKRQPLSTVEARGMRIPVSSASKRQ